MPVWVKFSDRLPAEKHYNHLGRVYVKGPAYNGEVTNRDLDETQVICRGESATHWLDETIMIDEHTIREISMDIAKAVFEGYSSELEEEMTLAMLTNIIRKVLKQTKD